MKKLYYSSCSIAAPHIGVVLDDVLMSHQRGDHVTWAYCNGVLPSCFMNLDGCTSYCRFCHRMYKEYAKCYVPDVDMHPLSREAVSHGGYPVIKEAKDVEKMCYRGVQVGYSILSMYYEVTRDLELTDANGLLSFAAPLTDRLCGFIDRAYRLIDEAIPDEILIFNGRLFENRLFYDIAKSLGITFTSLEAVGGRVEPYRKIRFEGGLPHDLRLYGSKVLSLWDSSPLSLEEKSRIAASFYTKRRQGVLVGDTKVYTSTQKENLLPEDFQWSRRNVAIFNSSQDEIAALGEDWSCNSLFLSQYEGIEYVLKHAEQDIHFYLRIHPNLAGVGFRYHMQLYELGKYPNVTVIPPESPVSTYALMDACEKVMTFGSTTGVEATFWGKPSILAGHSYYEMSDACYIAKSPTELIDLINRPLTPKPAVGALKYAYFLVDRQFAVEKSMIDIDVRYIRLHWNFFSTSYFKLYHSKLIFQVLFFIYCILGVKFSSRQLHFPWPEHK